MDEKRRAALERRATLVAATRGEIEQTVHDATDRLRAQTAAARQQIDRDADTLAATIVERVLGRKAS
jgi:Tfp pilus assembly protein PilN